MQINSISDLASIVRGRRQELRLTQAEVAARAGVSRTWVSYFEGGRPNAEIGLVIRLLDVLGLGLELLPRAADAPTAGVGVDLDALLDDYRAG